MPTVSFLLSLKAILNTIYSKFWNFDFLLFTASATYHLVSIINQALELSIMKVSVLLYFIYKLQSTAFKKY